MQELLFSALERFIVRPDLPVDERRKRVFLMLFLITTIPALLGFGLWNSYHRGLALDVTLNFVGVVVSIANLFALRYARRIHVVYRVGVCATLTLLTYVLATGGGYGIGYIWFYFHPLATFFIFGSAEGLFWVIVSWLLAVMLMIFNLGPYDYPLHIGIRFVVSYTMVSILAYGLEAGRKHYYEQLVAEKVTLEAALQQVKTLQGLLPICASCKKIRDDGGYWHQVESYMRDHAGIEFSHSICPDCRTRLYAPACKAETISKPFP